jgi:hypothetical protein
MTEKLLTTKEVAGLLGVSMAFLERDRWAGTRIPFVRIGSRSVRLLPAWCGWIIQRPSAYTLT